jgi:hypothetical protein
MTKFVHSDVELAIAGARTTLAPHFRQSGLVQRLSPRVAEYVVSNLRFGISQVRPESAYGPGGTMMTRTVPSSRAFTPERVSAASPSSVHRPAEPTCEFRSVTLPHPVSGRTKSGPKFNPYTSEGRGPHGHITVRNARY